MTPFDLSISASMMVPIFLPFGLALMLMPSAVNRIASSKSSMPVLCLAETGMIIVSPSQSSGTSPFSDNCRFANSGFASGRSILLRATIIGTLAALACAIASLV